MLQRNRKVMDEVTSLMVPFNNARVATTLLKDDYLDLKAASEKAGIDRQAFACKAEELLMEMQETYDDIQEQLKRFCRGRQRLIDAIQAEKAG